MSFVLVGVVLNEVTNCKWETETFSETMHMERSGMETSQSF